MSPRLRSNWRRPGTQAGAATESPEGDAAPITNRATVAADAAAPEEGNAPKPRTRRAPVRSRAAKAVAEEEPTPEAANENAKATATPEAPAAEARSPRRRTTRTRNTAASPIEETVAQPAGNGRSDLSEDQTAPNGEAEVLPDEAGHHNPTADAARNATAPRAADSSPAGRRFRRESTGGARRGAIRLPTSRHPLVSPEPRLRAHAAAHEAQGPTGWHGELTPAEH